MSIKEMSVYARDHEPWRMKTRFWVTDSEGHHWVLWRIEGNELIFVRLDDPLLELAEPAFKVSIDPNDSFRQKLEAYLRLREWVFTDPIAVSRGHGDADHIKLVWEDLDAKVTYQ